MSTSASFNQEFSTETWTLYGVGMFLILTRLAVANRSKLMTFKSHSASQTRRLGLKRLRTDDWVIITVIPWYTLLVVSINKIIFGGGSNYMSPEDIAALTPQTTADRISGSKWVLVSEEVMVLCVWTCKICMLLIYRRLTEGLTQERLINAVLIYVLVGFVACQIALFTTCRPFSGYWSVPAIDDQCWSYFNFEIVEGSFNISADLVVLLVAIPLLLKLRIPIQQKIILVGVFGMGAFVIAAAVLTKVYSLDPNLVSYAYLNWYFREASVSIYVTNLPAVWALVRDIFPSVKYWGYPQGTYSDGNVHNRKVWPSQYGSDVSGQGGRDLKDDLEMFDCLGITNSTDGLDANSRSQSQERSTAPSLSEVSTTDHRMIYKDVAFPIAENQR